MFEQWGLGDVLQGFPANNFLEIRVDGRSRLLAEDLPGLETAGKTVPQQALVRGPRSSPTVVTCGSRCRM
jgi:hypothetical protein